MNKIMKTAVFGFLSAFIFSGCSKKVSEIIYQGGTAPVLVTSVSADSVSYANADKTILTLNWTNPNYTFTTGTSSLDVTYTLQVDTAGANFNNAYAVTVSKDLSDQFTASALNDIMQNQLNLKPNIQHKLEMRVISTLLNNSASLNSNTVQFNATLCYSA